MAFDVISALWRMEFLEISANYRCLDLITNGGAINFLFFVPPLFCAPPIYTDTRYRTFLRVSKQVGGVFVVVAAMLPLGLKIAWFVLSFLGMICCWTVLMAFASVMQTYWPALVYCLGVTCIEGMFWLGIVWRMDPISMPHSFCLAQAFISSLGSYLLAGVIASLTIATFRFVSRPKRWPNGEFHVLAWRMSYLVPLLLFPILALAAQIAVTLSLDAVQPTNSLTCDAINPIWTRFLGYAGSPLLLCIPSFCVTVYCLTRVHKTHQHIMRSRTRYPKAMQDNFTSPPTRRPHTPRAIATPSPTARPMSAAGREQLSSTMLVSSRRFHLPFTSSSRTDLKNSSRNSSHVSMPREAMSSDSVDSDTFPTFAPPSNAPSINEISKDHRSGGDKCLDSTDVTSIPDVEKDVWRLKETDTANTDIDGAMEMVQWKKGSIEPVPEMVIGEIGHDRVDADDEDDSSWNKSIRHSAAPSQRSRRPMLSELPSTIFCLIRFQLIFNLLQFINSIATLVYAIRRHSPPFHIHHVTLLLFAWAPVLFFGSLPEVQQQLRFWPRRSLEQRADGDMERIPPPPRP